MTTEKATTTTAATTTEPGRRTGLSVRFRIAATLMVLVALCLGGTGAVVYGIESQRLEEDIVHSVDQEFAELAALRKDGVDPDTREPFADVRSMLLTFLGRNVPDDSEMLVAWVGGAPDQYLAGSEVEEPSRDTPLLEDPAFLKAAREAVAVGGDRRISTEREGDVLIAAQPVVQGEDTGALVVVVHLDAERAGLVETMRTYLLVALASLALITALAAWQSGRLLRPLRTLRTTADEITGSDLSRRIPESGNDDLTALTRTVNGMLDRLEATFVGQREFLDDAGHELKTPLTILRGHLELLDSASPEDVATTRELLLDEVDRMARLVGDLILLAKSSRPDFLSWERVDVGRLTRSVLAKARGLGDRDWQLDDTAARIVALDEQRLTQALLQLADNAVKHTAPGDEIALGSAWEPGAAGGVVRLWVRDAGPGVPPADRERIFERFGRSVVPDHDEGFGLGLSIVAAIARAHDGTIAVEDAPGGGARFVITLPARSAGPAEGDPWPAS